jgi:DUF1680 family protein
VAPTEIAVHLYAQSSARLDVDGTAVTLTQTTDCPWAGAISTRVEPQAPADFMIRLRVPTWCRAASLAVNGRRSMSTPWSSARLSGSAQA